MFHGHYYRISVLSYKKWICWLLYNVLCMCLVVKHDTVLFVYWIWKTSILVVFVYTMWNKRWNSFGRLISFFVVIYAAFNYVSVTYIKVFPGSITIHPVASESVVMLTPQPWAPIRENNVLTHPAYNVWTHCEKRRTNFANAVINWNTVEEQ